MTTNFTLVYDLWRSIRQYTAAYLININFLKMLLNFNDDFLLYEDSYFIATNNAGVNGDFYGQMFEFFKWNVKRNIKRSVKKFCQYIKSKKLMVACCETIRILMLSLLLFQLFLTIPFKSIVPSHHS